MTDEITDYLRSRGALPTREQIEAIAELVEQMKKIHPGMTVRKALDEAFRRDKAISETSRRAVIERAVRGKQR